MIIQVDQSNKIEKTNKDTIIGLADGKNYSILINRKIKRKLQEEFRKQGKPKLFVYRTFIAGVVLLIKYAKLDNIQKIIIDQEYFGKNRVLKSMFLEMWSRFYTDIPEVSFEEIGKKSKAHSICYLTMKRKYKVDKTIEYQELRKLALK